MEEWRIELKQEIQKELLSSALKSYGIKHLTNKFGINHSVVYHYKNYRIKSMPLEMFLRISMMLGIDERMIQKEIISTFNEKTRTKKILDQGRTKRKEKLKQNIPSVQDIIDKQRIHLEKWFKAYIKL